MHTDTAATLASTEVLQIKELETLLTADSFNGIIVGLKTKLSAPKDQKTRTSDLLAHFPVLQSRIIPGTRRLQTLPFGIAPYDVSLEVFLTEECPKFIARKLRSAARHRIRFNVMLSKSGDFSAEDLEPRQP